MLNPDEMPRRLGAFLTARAGQDATVVSYKPMIGGYSRLMARADIRWKDGRTETVVLRGDPPPGKAMMETDRDVEWALLQSLTQASSIPMAKALHYDGTGSELGTKCIVLEFVEGSSLQALLNTCDPAQGYGRHTFDLVDTMARVHRIDPNDVGSAIPRPTDWSSYIDTLIDRFRQAEAAHVESNPFLRYVAGWLQANKPAPLPLRLVHSDFQPANIMVDPSGDHLMIDWELAHIGDPREDIGYYAVYSASSGPSLIMSDPVAFLARYREQTGFSEEAVNLATLGYFSSLAAITVYAQVLGGAGAMARGLNAGILTTYTLNALTVGHSNFMAGCIPPAA
ncbi:MAG: phosphotransferase family protein [Actinobacteria bacterium]|nr:phosphotransferase family protein [Actinomycetota bacterium]